VGAEAYAAWVAAAKVRNADHYVPLATASPRYAQKKNSKNPKKIGSHLELFDCVTCDKCIPVCPNDANFAFSLPPMEAAIETLGLINRLDGQGNLVVNPFAKRVVGGPGG